MMLMIPDVVFQDGQTGHYTHVDLAWGGCYFMELNYFCFFTTWAWNHMGLDFIDSITIDHGTCLWREQLMELGTEDSSLYNRVHVFVVGEQQHPEAENINVERKKTKMIVFQGVVGHIHSVLMKISTAICFCYLLYQNAQIHILYVSTMKNITGPLDLFFFSLNMRLSE
ncbi:hypothetical protein ACJX0J_018727 [Zea mays]